MSYGVLRYIIEYYISFRTIKEKKSIGEFLDRKGKVINYKKKKRGIKGKMKKKRKEKRIFEDCVRKNWNQKLEIKSNGKIRV